jgi:glycosyltransferase involved in cell wall biosynthesis
MHYGGQISLYNLVKRLDREKYDLCLVCPAPGPLSRAFSKINCKITYLSFPQIRFCNIFKIPIILIKTLTLLKNNNIQIVHSDHPTDTFYLAVCARILRIPLIWHARVSFSSRLDSINLRLVSKVIGVSDAVSKRFEYSGRVSPKYITIFNGVDSGKFSSKGIGRVRQELGLNSNEMIITTICQMKPEKGIQNFIEAAKRIQKHSENCYFIMVGSGDETFIENQKKRINKYGLQTHVYWLGVRTDIVNILDVTDVFILASMPNVEGLPRVVIEAMSCGKPVVGTDVHGINEAVEDGVTGLLVPHENPESLAHATLTLVKDIEKRRVMGRSGRENVKKKFSIESNVSKTARLYEQLI